MAERLSLCNSFISLLPQAGVKPQYIWGKMFFTFRSSFKLRQWNETSVVLVFWNVCLLLGFALDTDSFPVEKKIKEGPGETGYPLKTNVWEVTIFKTMSLN